MAEAVLTQSAQEAIHAKWIADMKRVTQRQEAHATRMRAKRAVQKEKKQAIIDKGDDVVLCLDCRNGSPEIRSADLIIEQKPRHPIVERRDARATGRLVIDPRPDTWTRFGSPIPSQHLPETPASFCALPGDRGVHIGVVLGIDDEEEDGAPGIIPGHQGDTPTACRVEVMTRLDWIDPKYAEVEPALGSYKNRKGDIVRRREIPWTM